MMWKKQIGNLVKSPWLISLLIMLLIYIFLFAQIPWNLIFTDTMVAGGDTGSHNYIAYKLASIFPTIKTWTHDWYGGFPFLYFYPPLMFVISTLLSFILKLNVAFKLTTLLGTLLLPICVYFGLKFLKFKNFIPEIGAVGSIMFLFLEDFSIYGANIPSTLAGEFSYSFSFALFFLFFGLFDRGMRENKYLIPNTLVLAIMALSHPFPVISATLYATLLMVVSQNRLKKAIYALKVFGLAFGITAFWSIPFLYYRSYTSVMSWYRTIKLSEMFPATLQLFWLASIVGLFFLIKNHNKKILNFLILSLSNLVLFLVINNSPIYNTRFLPFFIMSYILMGSIGLGYLIKEITIKSKLFNIVLVVIIILWNLILIDPNFILGKNTKVKSIVKYIPFWMEWNYKGFEDKEAYRSGALPLFEYLKSLPYGKIMWEYRPEYDTFGTPRFLENLPVLTGKPTFEGLLIESSVFGPFHFINQTETTQSPTSAIAGFEYPPFDFKKGVEHLKMANARYFVAYTDNIKQLAKENMTWLNNVGPFSVYELPANNLVDVYNDFQIVKKQKDWIKESISWYKGENINQPIVFYQNNWQKNILEKSDRQTDILPVKINELKENKLTFSTENIGKLHLIKISYFPTWKVKGGYGPFLVSPSFIGVVPTEKNVVVYFAKGLIDNLSYLITYLSILIVTIKVFRPKWLKWL